MSWLALSLGAAQAASAAILITEVIPNVSTTASRGDVVELYNAGPGAVDLTDWVLTDLDADPVAGVPQDATFAPGSLGLESLAEGEFAVVEFVDVAGVASWQSTNYGLRIVAPLVAGSFLGSERDELLLVDDAGTPVDFVAWADAGTTVSVDSREDLSAVTGVVFDYGLVPGDAAWDGAETIASDADYYASAVDFTAFASVSTWGGGALRRVSTAGVFAVGAPDGVAEWEAIPRHAVRLGNASDDLPTADGLQPVRVTTDLGAWLGQIKTTTFPDRRIARFADQNPADFVPVDDVAKGEWEGVLALALAGEWDATFAAADLLGYEVVEVLDTATEETYHVLRERTVPGEIDFRGQGLFVFYAGPGVRPGLVLQVPHPVFESGTLEQGAQALALVRPQVLAIAGTHRNNHLDETTCDGSFQGGDAYRVSDVAHHPGNFFHATHVWMESNLDDIRAVQLHGFCCPGQEPYESLTDDVVVSNGLDDVPGFRDLSRLLTERIDAQGFLADGVDLTTAGLFGDGVSTLGGTNNLQGRVSNGVTVGTECNTAAGGASGRFSHVEQDPDVREEPEHVLIALAEAFDQAAAIPPCDTVPALDCRSSEKSSLVMVDKEGGLRDRLVWKWIKGEATDLADFSDAVGGDAVYQVCLYDDSGEAQPRVDSAAVAGGTCAGLPCWKALGTKGYLYKDRFAVAGGLQKVLLKSGAPGKAKLLVSARGESVGMPALPLTPPVVVQLAVIEGDDTSCWQSTFQAPKKNEPGKFKAKE